MRCFYLPARVLYLLVLLPLFMPKPMLNNHIQEYRQKKNLTQEALADLVGVSRQTIISIEKGNYVPSLELAFSLAKTFKVTVEKLFFMSTKL